MITSKQKKLILSGFDRLDPLTAENIDGRRRIYDLERKNESNHRLFCSGREYPASAPMSLTAKYWSVKHILTPLFDDPNRYSVEDILDIKESIIWGQALANKYRDQLLESFKGFDLIAFNELDYVEMVALPGLESNTPVDLGGHWAEAFSKFGWGDGDNNTSGTDLVAQEIRALGYEVATEFWGIHNYMVQDMLKDGEMVISDWVRLGYDNPRDYLPSELINALDGAFKPYPEPALFD